MSIISYKRRVPQEDLRDPSNGRGGNYFGVEPPCFFWPFSFFPLLPLSFLPFCAMFTTSSDVCRIVKSSRNQNRGKQRTAARPLESRESLFFVLEFLVLVFLILELVVLVDKVEL